MKINIGYGNDIVIKDEVESSVAVNTLLLALNSTPDLQKKVENMIYFTDWDDTTTALLKIAAAKLHSSEERLSLDYDNDSFLHELSLFNWQVNYRDMPAFLKAFALKVASMIAFEPDYFRVLLPDKSNRISNNEEMTERMLCTVPEEQNNCSAAAGVVTTLVWKVCCNVIEKCCMERVPRLRLRNICESLHIIFLGSSTPQQKFDEVCTLLRNIEQEMPASAGPVLKTSLRNIVSGLEAASIKWLAMEKVMSDAHDTQSISGHVIELMEIMEIVLSDSQQYRGCEQDGLQHTAYILGTVKETLKQIHFCQKLPDKADLNDYLRVLVNNRVVLQTIDESTLTLAKTLANIQHITPYPHNGSLSSRMTWLIDVLSDCELRMNLQSHIEMMLGGKKQADWLFAMFHFVDHLRRFPTNRSLLGQAIWLINIQGLPLPAPLQSVLGDSTTLGFVNRLLSLNQGTEAQHQFQFMQHLAKAMAQSIGPLLAGYLAKRVLPTELVDQLEKFYRESTPSESWATMCRRLATGLWAVATPWLVGQWSGHPFAAATIQYAEVIQTHTSWEQTFKWFADQSDNGQMRMVYSQYLNVMLLWQVCQALCNNDTNETEAILRRLSRSLRASGVVKSYPQLGILSDLLPLLPALCDAQKTLQVALPDDSWLAWIERWINALAHSHSKHCQALRRQLVTWAENWLADTLLTVFDAMTLCSWSLLPGAMADDAVPPDIVRHEVTEDDWMRIDNDKMWPEGAGWADTLADGNVAGPVDRRTKGLLLTGISLEALGLAAIGYALWQWRRTSTPLPVEGTLLCETRGGNMPAGLADENSALQTSAQKVFAHKQPVVTHKLPLLLGVAALTAGGGCLYKWFTRCNVNGISEGEYTSEHEYEQEMKIIAEMATPALGFFFADLSVDMVNLLNRAGKTKVKRGIREKFHTPVIANAIKASLDTVKDPKVKDEFHALLKKASNAIVPDASKSENVQDITRLINCIEMVSRFLDEIENELGRNISYKYGRALLKRLWDIAEQAPRDETESLLMHYKVHSNIVFLGQKSLRKFKKLYQPILHLPSYIAEYVEQGIRSYEKTHGIQTGLKSTSLITVSFKARVAKNFNYHITQPVEKKRSFTLVEIITGQYLYVMMGLRDHLGRKYEIISMQHQPVIDMLLEKNLQSDMEHSLNVYFDNSFYRTGLESYYRDMIRLRCLAYMDTPGVIFKTEVTDFVVGKIQAREVFFHDSRLNGVFLVPAGAGGVLFSVDESAFWELKTSKVSHGGEKIPIIPATDKFEKWVLNKIPSFDAQKIRNSDNPFNYTRYNNCSDGVYINRIRIRPFEFRKTVSVKDLLSKLVEGLKERLAADIDHVVFTRTEQLTEKMLEVLKTILEVGSFALTVAIPGTGSILGRFCLFLTALALDASAVGASMLQAHMSDKPEQVDAFRNEAIMASLLVGIGTVVGGGAFANQLAKSTIYFVNDVNQALGVYRMVRKSFPKTIARIEHIACKRAFSQRGRDAVFAQNRREWKPVSIFRSSASDTRNIKNPSTNIAKIINEYNDSVSIIYLKCRSRIKRGMSAGVDGLCLLNNVGNENGLSVNDIYFENRSHYEKLSEGAFGDVCKFDNVNVIKYYKNTFSSENKSVLIKAVNNAKGMNRFYGAGSATVIIKDVGDTEAMVAVKMRHIKGLSLDDILKNGDFDNIDSINNLLVVGENPNMIEVLVDRLDQAKIVHNDINIGNIIFDKETKELNVVDFDDAMTEDITNASPTLGYSKRISLQNKIEHCMNSFKRKSKLMRVFDFNERLVFTRNKKNLMIDEAFKKKTGKLFIFNERLNESWSLRNVIVNVNDLIDTNAIGSEVKTVFFLKYQPSGSVFVELPMLSWFETIKMNDVKNISWVFKTNMYQHHHGSITFLPWRNRYVLAYEYAKAAHKENYSSLVEIFDVNMRPLEPNRIATTNNPSKKVEIIKNYLKEKGGFMNVSIIDKPRLMIPTTEGTRERVVKFDLGFGEKSYVRFNQGIVLNSEGKHSTFITSSDDIRIANQPVNASPPDGVANVRAAYLFNGEVVRK